MRKPLKPINQIFQWLAAATFGLAAFFALKNFWWQIFAPAPANEISSPAKIIRNPFAGLDLEARAALVFAPDENKILFAKNAGAPLPIASLAKVMMALAAETEFERGKPIQFNGHTWRLANLINYTLVSSSNAAAAAIAAAGPNGHSLVATMNNLARTLDLTTTYFDNPTGLDLTNGDPGGVSSAMDLARLLTYILKNRPELITATRYPELEVVALDGIRYRVTNTNKMVSEIPGLLASKTGYTDAAAGSLIVIVDRGLNEPMVLIVLGSSFEGRFIDMEKLIAATYVYDY